MDNAILLFSFFSNYISKLCLTWSYELRSGHGCHRQCFAKQYLTRHDTSSCFLITSSISSTYYIACTKHRISLEQFHTKTQKREQKRKKENMEAGVIKEVANKPVILKDYSSDFPKESDWQVNSRRIRLRVLKEPKNAVVLTKNLYLSCDPAMGFTMRGVPVPCYIYPCKPASVGL